MTRMTVAVATFANHILHVVGLGAWNDVRRVTAKPEVARMVALLAIRKWLPVRKFPRYLMSPAVVVSVPECTVRLVVLQIKSWTDPGPARIWPARAVNLRPEALSPLWPSPFSSTRDTAINGASVQGSWWERALTKSTNPQVSRFARCRVLPASTDLASHPAVESAAPIDGGLASKKRRAALLTDARNDRLGRHRKLPLSVSRSGSVDALAAPSFYQLGGMPRWA
jgi:hypothetical protein